jgi:hypothetical protein
MSAARAGLLCFLLVPGLLGCGSLRAPRGALPAPAAAQQEAFGGWAVVRHVSGGVQTVSEGELIAVGADTLWLIRGDTLTALPTSYIRHAQVIGYDSRPGTVTAAAALGFVSTISNGAFLILTAPAWLVTGAVGSRAQARYARVIASPPSELGPLSQYARFPQGLTSEIDRSALRSGF